MSATTARSLSTSTERRGRASGASTIQRWTPDATSNGARSPRSMRALAPCGTVAVASGREFDAVCCGNDTMATAVAGVLAEAGIRVPTDVAITGMDNLAGLTGQDDNSLTTIDLRLSALGDRAANYLADVIGGTEYAPGRHVEPALLVAGLSTAR
ncbi:substrate-binding domain-containing protein [Microbacterium testaceum]|uniref:substrate-binding domain-containing protein n=1 Tax=Microbacterium testaceum TaxID=2033 RepID=UPI003448AE51